MYEKREETGGITRAARWRPSIVGTHSCTHDLRLQENLYALRDGLHKQKQHGARIIIGIANRRWAAIASLFASLC
jgi:hypothetical protein